jgi:hypothetical protein
MQTRKRGRPRKPVDPDKPIREPWRPVDDAAWLVFVSLWEKFQNDPAGKLCVQELLAEFFDKDRYQANSSIAGIEKRAAVWRKMKRAGYRLIEFEGFNDILGPGDAATYTRLLAAGFHPRDAMNIIAKGNHWELGRRCDQEMPKWAIRCLQRKELYLQLLADGHSPRAAVDFILNSGI